MSDRPPIACDLTAIDEDERQFHRRTSEAVFDAVEGLRELPDGYAFQLSPETDIIQKTGTFISGERRCCPFFHFTLEVEPNRGPVWLKLTGRDGVKQYIEEAVLPHWDAEESAP